MAIRFWELYEENYENFKLNIVAGRTGMDTVVSWVHMLEDETIVSRFNGEELAITTGMKTSVKPEWLLDLVKQMKRCECAGIIINTGMYIHSIPDVVVRWCEEHNFPVLTMPWDKAITDLIQQFCMRIMDQKLYEKRIGTILLKAMNGTGTKQEYQTLQQMNYELNGVFQTICIYIKRVNHDETTYTQSMRKLENVFGIGKNENKIVATYCLLTLQDHLVLVLNEHMDTVTEELPEMIRQCFLPYSEAKHLYLGVGPKVKGIENLNLGYGRAKIAMRMAIGNNKWYADFEQMGVYKILYSVEDQELLKNYAMSILSPILEYDKEHDAGYLDTLRSYIKYDRSLIAVAEATFTHRNTVNYRVQNMKKLLKNELKTVNDLFPYEVALMIFEMLKQSENE